MPTAGQIATNSTIPFGGQTLDQATWVTGAAQKLLNGIINQAYQLGDASMVGMPTSWPYGPIQNEDILSGGSASPILAAKVQNYVNSQAAQADADFNSWVGADYSSATAGGWIDKPLSPTEQAALRAQQLKEQEFLMKMVRPGGSSGGSSGGSTVAARSYVSGGSSGGGSNSPDYAARLAYEGASNDLDYQFALQKMEIEKEIALFKASLANDPNNPELAFRREELDERVRQFNASLALQRESQGIDRAKVIADYSANPGDMVARQYFLNQGMTPKGTPVDIFTGKQAGTQPMSFEEIMRHNAPAVAGPLGGIVQPPAAAPSAPVPPPVPERPLKEPGAAPQFAHGTSMKTSKPPLPTTGQRPWAPGTVTDGAMKPGPTVEPTMQPGQPVPPQPPGPTSIPGPVVIDDAPPPSIPGPMNSARPAIPPPSIPKMGLPAGAPPAMPPSNQPAPPPATGPRSPISWLEEFGNRYSLPPHANDMARRRAFTQRGRQQRADPQLTSDGWTRASSFIAGDPQTGMTANPERIDMRVRNGEPEAKVQPLPPQEFMKPRPQFAWGTDALGQATWLNDDGSTTYDWLNDPTYGGAPTQSLAYQPSTATSYQYDPSRSYALDSTSGTVAQMGDSGFINNDPYYGTPYAGMAPSDLVKNANSAYYGQTVESALAAQVNADRAPSGYTVGPTGYGTVSDFGGIGSDYVPANYGVQGYRMPSAVVGGGDPGAYVNVQNQADAGILTGAQISQGQTQSTNPLQANYVSPLVDKYGIPGQVPQNTTTTTSGGLSADTTTDSAQPATTTAAASGTPQAPGMVTTAGEVKSPDGAATYMLMPGDIPAPDGFGYLRYDPLRKDYVPIQPSYTPITSREQFFSLPPATQQAILTGQKTGYVLLDDGTGWMNDFARSNVISPEAFAALSPEEQKKLLMSGVFTGEGGITSGPAYDSTGPLMSFPTGGMVTGQTDPRLFDYANYLTQEQFDKIMYPQSELDMQDDIAKQRQMSAEKGFLQYQRDKILADAEAANNTPIPPPPAVPPPPAGGGPSATGTKPGPGEGAGSSTGGGTPTHGTPGAPLSPEQILALTYGSDIWQNLPALQYLMGNMSGGDYSNVTNQEIEVPGLGIRLPAPAQAMNYGMLLELMKSGGFDALNSLYTAGNMPLSMIAEIAKSRAPLGSAFDSSLITS